MDEIKTKQQVIEKIKEANKILVTVSDSPSVDALSAALGLTLLFDKQEKYATAIFSGETPPAIAFLEPEKTFDDTTDSLRDFIIALNKEKADHLRYKVVDDAVKIFITPYKTTIDQGDLEFSQGDYNVELVIALGVDSQERLDKALDDHGQILHDAAIITMTTGEQTSDLGGIDWHDSNSSSLSEMVAGLAEALKTDKKKPLLDEPIATALLTGIVAATDRFSNEHTTSRAMTVAATLMAAGADQQLISNELQAAVEAPVTEDAAVVSGDESAEDPAEERLPVNEPETEKDATKLEISHEGETLADLDRRVRHTETPAPETPAPEAPAETPETQPEAVEADAGQEPVSEQPLVAEPAVIEQPLAVEQPPVVESIAADAAMTEPVLGGTLNATTEQAADDARRQIESDQNRTILSHSYLGDGAATSAADQSVDAFAEPSAPGSAAVSDTPTSDVQPAYSFDTPVGDTDASEQSGIAIGGEHVIQPLHDPASEAPAPVAPPQSEPVAAYGLGTAPAAEFAAPADLGLPLPPPLPDFSQMNGAAPAFPVTSDAQPAILGDILAPEPPQAIQSAYAVENQPVDQFAGAPAPAMAAPVEAPVTPVGAYSAPADPGQFQIPSQQ